MKLNNKITVLHTDDTTSEVSGEFIPYEYNGHKFQLMVHESLQPWVSNVMAISEVTTGCFCTHTGKPVSSSTKADIKVAMDTFIKEHGLIPFQEQIKKRKLELDKS